MPDRLSLARIDRLDRLVQQLAVEADTPASRPEPRLVTSSKARNRSGRLLTLLLRCTIEMLHNRPPMQWLAATSPDASAIT